MAMASFCPESEVDDDGDFHSRTPIRTTQLGASAQEFLDHLRLPLMHPFCPGYATEDDDDVSAGDGNANAAIGEADTDEMMDLLSRIGTGSIFELPNKRLDDMYFNIDKTTTTLETDSDDADANINGFGHEAIAPSQLLTSHLHRHLLKQQQQPASPIIGPISLLELHDHSISEVLVTATTMSAPTLAMMELWLRFFAVFLCPLCLCYMIQWEIKLAITNNTKPCRANDTTISTTVIGIYLVGLASSAVLFTDSLYVYEYGRWFGFALFVLSSVMAIRCATSTAVALERSKEVRGDEDDLDKCKGIGKRSIYLVARRKIFLFRCVIALLISTTTIVFLRSDGGHAMEAAIQRFIPLLSSAYYQPDNNLGTNSNTPHLEQLVPKDPGIDLPTIKEGLYHSSSNPLITSIVSHWPESSRTYTVANGATSYLVNGDQRTGIPFLVNKVEEEEYVRVWTQNKFDGEYLALDIAFPYSDSVKEGNMDDNGDGERQHHFVHDYTKPVYLVLHGLNGGSHEEYVKDLVKRRRSEGSTVLVLIARGMMDTKLVGWNAFHGARTGDIDAAARAIRRGLIALAEAHRLRPDQRQILAGVGYSMGAIILSNYVARSGRDCALDAAMAISGGLDMRQQLNFKRSMRLWQPMLTFGLREDILIGKYARHYKHRLAREQFFGMLRSTSISALDVEAIVTYNSFEHLVHYYSEMSAMGDRDPEFQLFFTLDSGSLENQWGRIANVSIPFAVLQALDDPLVGWRTLGTNDLQGLADSGSGNVMLVLTKAGGHVGWPLGSNPAQQSWKWMNNAARDFVLAVDAAKQSLYS